MTIKDITGKRVMVTANLTLDDAVSISYTHGRKGTVIKQVGTTVWVQLDDEDRFPVPYRYFKGEVGVIGEY